VGGGVQGENGITKCSIKITKDRKRLEDKNEDKEERIHRKQ
jgi:hypothetical protein